MAQLLGKTCKTIHIYTCFRLGAVVVIVQPNVYTWLITLTNCMRKRTWKMYLPVDNRQWGKCKRELSTPCVFVRLKEERQTATKGKEEAEKRTDEEATKLDKKYIFLKNSFDPVWLLPPHLSSSPLLPSFCCCLSFFFYLTKTLSVESTRLYFSHRLSSIGEYIFQVLFLSDFDILMAV